MTAAKEASVGVPDETVLLGELAEALRRVRRGESDVALCPSVGCSGIGAAGSGPSTVAVTARPPRGVLLRVCQFSATRRGSLPQNLP